MKKILLTILVIIFGLQSGFSQAACGGQFIDSGGISGNYQNNETFVTTICTDNPLDSVTITFTSFSLDNNDTLSVYDGLSLGDTLLGTYTGTTIPNSITATNFIGCLTFVFTSNESGVSDGWIADVTCAPNPCAIFYNSATLTFCDPIEMPMYNLEDALPQILINPTDIVVTFHQTLTDAQTGSFPISSPFIPMFNPGQQTLYVKGFNTEIGCYAITTLTLNTNNCISNCVTPINLVASSVLSTSITLNWTQPQDPAGFIATDWDVVALPIGSPAPNNTTTGFVFTSSNPYVYHQLYPNTCYTFYVRAVCSSTVRSDWSLPIDICMPNCNENGTCENVIYLNSFLDSNNNGIKDNDEVNFNQGNFVYQVNNSGNDIISYGNNGNYVIYDDDLLNNYNISYTVNSDLNNYYTCSTTYSNINVESNNGNYYYFPVTITQPYIDASVTIFNSSNPVPGFQYNVMAGYTNNGNQTIPSGTITFTKDANLSILSVSESGTITTSNGFTFNFTNLLPFETRYFYITFQVPTIPTVSLGQLVTNSVSIAVINDENSSNNSSSLTQEIVGSYDPNDISESHGEKILYSTFTNNDYLYYTIRFENTGTANAQFIKVENTLDSKLDETTFEVLHASHNVNATIIENNINFRFYNINLPPTSIQPNDSHGFITYRIKPNPGYAIGDIIPNFANIYFDYNPAIVTNTFNTEFVAALENTNVEMSNLVVFPNPSNNTIYINLQNTTETINSVTITDVLGKAIKTITNIENNEVNTDVSYLSQGVYFVEVSTTNNLKLIKKLIKQ